MSNGNDGGKTLYPIFRHTRTARTPPWKQLKRSCFSSSQKSRCHFIKFLRTSSNTCATGHSEPSEDHDCGWRFDGFSLHHDCSPWNDGFQVFSSSNGRSSGKFSVQFHRHDRPVRIPTFVARHIPEFQVCKRCHVFPLLR